MNPISALAAAAILVPTPSISLAETLFAKARPHVEKRQSYVMVTLNYVVGPNGRIVSCTVGRAVGAIDLAPLFCAKSIDKKVGPPLGQGGASTYAVVNYTTSAFAGSQLHRVNEAIDEILALPNSGDPISELQLDDFSSLRTTFVHVDLAIRSDGSMQSCVKGDKGLVYHAGKACKLLADKRFDIIRDKSGNPVDYVRKVRLIPVEYYD